MAAAAASFSTLVLHTKAAIQPEATPDGDSAFMDNCRDNNAGKYRQYDNTVAYPIIAFWLMLTTDEWDACMDSDHTVVNGKPKRTPEEARSWRTKLANELGVAPSYVEWLYDKSHTNPPNKAAFKKV